MNEQTHARQAYKIDPAKKVAIMGFASSSRGQAPFDDPSFEIWILNSLYSLVPRYTRLYEIHPKHLFTKDLNRAELQQVGLDHYEYLKSRPGPGQEGYTPIFMQEHYPEIPASLPWPRAEINAWTTAMFGPEAELDYFTSTPGEMVVHAIYEGYGEIHLYGVDLLQDEEYAYQRPGCEYWLGIARGLGIKVVVPPSSALLKANYVYGYVEPPVDFGSMKGLVDFWEGKRGDLEKLMQQAAAMLNTLNGAKQIEAAVRKHIAEGESAAQVLAYLDKELENLNKQFEVGQQNLFKLQGQAELANSAAAWTAHFGRGGKLEGM